MSASVDTVVFDLGGVLIEVDNAGAMRWLEQKGCSVDDPRSFAARTGMHEHEIGRLSGTSFCQRVVELLTSPVTAAEIRDWWTGFFAPDDDMLQLARDLGENYRVFILSNTGPLHWEQAMQQFRLEEIARDFLTSFEAGVAKPDAQIYELARQRFALEPGRTVFVDDLVANVRGAQAAGWHGVHHNDFGSTAQQLARLGVSPRPGR